MPLQPSLQSQLTACDAPHLWLDSSRPHPGCRAGFWDSLLSWADVGPSFQQLVPTCCQTSPAIGTSAWKPSTRPWLTPPGPALPTSLPCSLVTFPVAWRCTQSRGDRGRRTSESRTRPPPGSRHPDHATSCLLTQRPAADREKPKPTARGFLSDPLQGPRCSCWMRLLVSMVTR